MVLYNLSEGRLEEGNREKGFEVGFWGLVFSDIRAGRTGPPGFRDPLRARIESPAVFFCADAFSAYFTGIWRDRDYDTRITITLDWLLTPSPATISISNIPV